MYLLFEILLLCKFKFSFILRLQLFFFNDQMQAFTESCQCGVVLRPLITTIYYFNSRLKEKPFPTVSGIMVFCYQRTLFSVSVSINEAQQLSFLILVISFCIHSCYPCTENSIFFTAIPISQLCLKIFRNFSNFICVQILKPNGSTLSRV